MYIKNRFLAYIREGLYFICPTLSSRVEGFQVKFETSYHGSYYICKMSFCTAQGSFMPAEISALNSYTLREITALKISLYVGWCKKPVAIDSSVVLLTFFNSC